MNPDVCFLTRHTTQRGSVSLCAARSISIFCANCSAGKQYCQDLIRLMLLAAVMITVSVSHPSFRNPSLVSKSSCISMKSRQPRHEHPSEYTQASSAATHLSITTVSDEATSHTFGSAFQCIVVVEQRHVDTHFRRKYTFTTDIHPTHVSFRFRWFVQLEFEIPAPPSHHSKT